MDAPPNDLNRHIADRIRALRGRRGLTLDALAERSGVSRSMLSLVERAESSPTAVTLDRIATGLGVPLASLFGSPETSRSPLLRREEQPLWQDPATGYVRRSLSPPGLPLSVQLVEVSFPPGGRLTYETAPHGFEQQLWVVDGIMEFTFGEDTYRLESGDCLALWLDRPIMFHNPTDRTARYLVAIMAGERRPSPASGGTLA